MSQVSDVVGPDYTMEEWEPTTGVAILLNVLALFLTIFAFLVLLLLYEILPGSSEASTTLFGSVEQSDDGTTTFSIDLLGMLLGLLAVIGAMILHELIHGFMFRLFGGRPSYGAALVARVLPVLYCTAHGYVFTRSQFTAIGLAPAVVITLLGLAVMALSDYGFIAMLAVAINFGGSIGDFWMVGTLWRKPAGTLVEDRKAGLRFYSPPV